MKKEYLVKAIDTDDKKLSDLEQILQQEIDTLQENGYEVIASYPIGTHYSLFGDNDREYHYNEKGVVLIGRLKTQKNVRRHHSK